MATDYVKCYTTRVSPEESQGHIIAMLHRYGASGFGFRRRGPVAEVTFHLPSDTGGDRTVQIPINIDVVAEKLRPKLDAITSGKKVKRYDAMQPERVAWRILLDWIDAALSAVTIGAQTIDEAFMAHTVVTTTDGQTGRMVDYVDTLKETSPAPGTLPGLGRPILPGLRDMRLIGNGK